MRASFPLFLLAILLCTSCSGAAAQRHRAGLESALITEPPQKAWVFFKDKGIPNTQVYEMAIDEVARNYNPRAVTRRQLRRTALNPSSRSGAANATSFHSVLNRVMDCLQLLPAMSFTAPRRINSNRSILWPCTKEVPPGMALSSAYSIQAFSAAMQRLMIRRTPCR